VGSALLSIVVVGMGASLGREGAPKQVGAVIANVLSDHANLSDEQRRLLVACGAGAGMAAAYGVPLGGALFGSLALGALLGSALGFAWSYIWPGVPQGLFAVLGAAAVLAATTHGPISSVVLIMELTARDRSFMLPLLVVVVLATLVSRTLDSRSIYDARFTDQEVNKMQRDRRPPAT
jgi:H+/Cl- antiporter ClcA